MEQGVAMPADGEDDIHGRCRQLEMALQHAQVTPRTPIKKISLVCDRHEAYQIVMLERMLEREKAHNRSNLCATA